MKQEGSGAEGSSRILPASSYSRMRWKNGAGWTSEILRVPDNDDWQWRLSIAEIEADAPFSAFLGVERELVLLSGNGLRLRFENGGAGGVHELLPPHDKLRFAGEHAAFSELIDGPTRDFNLMWKRDSCNAQLWHRPLVGTMVIFVDSGEAWAVHMLAGQARFADDSGLGSIQMGDTAILVADGNRTRHVLDGGGELLLIRVMPLPD
jgi:environmental stress-induced protein Ves